MADTNPAAAAINAVQQQQTGEPTTEQTTAPVVSEKQTQAADPQLEAFARKERQFHKMRQELANERAQIKAKLAEYETGYIPKAKLTEDPLAVLTEAGVSYEKLTEAILNQPNLNDPTTRALMNKIKALEEKQSQAAKAQEEAAQRQYQDAVKQITSEVKQLVTADETFEMIRETGLHDAVTELIEQTYNSEGYLMDIKEACQQVEDELLAQAEKLAKAKKVQSRLAPKAEVNADVKTEQPSITPKTLTNAVSATPTKRLSEKERIARAMAAFNGQLKE